MSDPSSPALPADLPPDLSPIEALIMVMARLRTPDSGCPWDLEQDFASIAPYTIEEAYEVADAIARNDRGALREELGDLLFQVVYHARMAEEEKAFDFNDVARAITDKMIRRHPHVFGDAAMRNATEQTSAWEEQKKAERAAKDQHGLLDDVPLALPALKRAAKLQKRAARVGFDWPDAAPVIDKIREEIGELTQEMENGSDPERLSAELGDLLFTCVNLARKLGIEPETALRDTNHRFERRFAHMEAQAATDGTPLEDCPPQRLETLWEAAKRVEGGR